MVHRGAAAILLAVRNRCEREKDFGWVLKTYYRIRLSALANDTSSISLIFLLYSFWSFVIK